MPEHRDDHRREDRDQHQRYDGGTTSEGDSVALEPPPGDLAQGSSLDPSAVSWLRGHPGIVDARRSAPYQYHPYRKAAVSITTGRVGAAGSARSGLTITGRTPKSGNKPLTNSKRACHPKSASTTACRRFDPPFRGDGGEKRECVIVDALRPQRSAIGYHRVAGRQLPTWMPGRRAGSRSIRRRISLTTGAV